MTAILLITTIVTSAFAGWRFVDASARADDLHAMNRRLNRRLAETLRDLSKTSIERNDYRTRADLLEDRLEATCSSGEGLPPKVVVNPREAQVGSRVQLTGRCLLEVGEDVTSIEDMLLIKSGYVHGCHLIADVRGTATVSTNGVLRGHFVVPRRGSCSSKEGRVTRGHYYLNFDCGGCPGSIDFEVVRRPYSWIDSIEEAAEWVAKKVDVPVALPPIPQGAHLNWEDPIDIGEVGDVTTASINVKLAEKRWLVLNYGVTSIWRDGCEPPAHRAVDVNGQRALLSKSRGYKWSTIVWPVEPGSLVGHYGIDGSVRPKKALELARAMDLAISTHPVETEQSC